MLNTLRRRNPREHFERRYHDLQERRLQLEVERERLRHRVATWMIPWTEATSRWDFAALGRLDPERREILADLQRLGAEFEALQVDIATMTAEVEKLKAGRREIDD